LHHPLINDTIQGLRPLLTERTRLRGVTIRSSPSTNRTLAVLDGKQQGELAEHWIKSVPALAGVTDKRGVVLAGEPALEHRVAGLHFRVSAPSFFQINYHQWEALVARVRDLLEPTPQTRVLDLYCGVGLFALTLAREVDSVVGVEAWQPAVDDAQHNAERNQLGNATFVAGNAEQVLAAQPPSFNRAVLDPPRRGCEPAVLDALVQQRPERIAYVSCHPGTLARDCKRLVEHGYRIASAEIIDMFPHTSHVESIVVLQR
jgi:23S rRNA (uracil1939-C5)-methyltransferase